MTSVSVTILLEQYETMLKLTQLMLEAAEKEEWDQLVSTAETRSSIADNLQQSDHIVWTLTNAQKKAAIIKAMLDLDADIKLRVESRMNALQGILGSINVEKKLKKAYE